ncbi:MAG: hypothetical protein IJD17_02680 [Clostridia bacterium]|nr:hypothetical protein [Clostridia bacterium]
MKKSIVMLCVILCVAVLLPLTGSAASWRIDENDVIILPNAVPTIDGTILDNEGWSASGWLNEMTSVGAWNTNPLTGTIEFNFAYSPEGLYVAARVVEIGAAYIVRYYDADGNTAYDAVFADPNAGSYTCTEGGYPTHTPEGDSIDYYLIDPHTTSAPAGVVPKNCFTYTYSGNSFQLASGEDDIDGEYSWNGDVIGISIDLLCAWEADGFLSNTDYLPQYNFSLFEDGSVKVARGTSTNDANITDMCKAAGTQTADGACFEVMIPWEIIVGDQNDLGAVMGLSTEFTVEDVIANGAVHRASVLWQDRFYDEEAGATDTWGRWITVCHTTAAGTRGYNSAVASMGLKLQIAGSDPIPGTDTTAPDTDPVTPDSNDITYVTTPVGPGTGNNDSVDTTKAPETTKKGVTTTTKAPTTNKNTSTSNNGSAQTFDAGIAVAIGVLATSALGAVYSKKRR